MMKFVQINDDLYTVARHIENHAEKVGDYDVYEFHGDTAGPRHPGTVVVRTVRDIMQASNLRRLFGLKTTDSIKVEYGVHKPNDTAINYLIQQKVITKNDMDRGYHFLNLFNLNAAQAVIRSLIKDANWNMGSDDFVVLDRKFANCALTPLLTQKKEERAKNPLL